MFRLNTHSFFDIFITNVLRHAGTPNWFNNFCEQIPESADWRLKLQTSNMQAWRSMHNYGPRAWSPEIPENYQTERHMERYIISTIPHWGPADPSLGDTWIAKRWTPKLEINTTTKNAKRPADSQRNRQTDILYYQSGHLNLWPTDACATLNYGPHELSPKSDAEYHTEIQRDI